MTITMNIAHITSTKPNKFNCVNMEIMLGWRHENTHCFT